MSFIKFIDNYLIGMFIAGFLSLVSAFEFNFLNISLFAIVLTLVDINTSLFKIRVKINEKE